VRVSPRRRRPAMFAAVGAITALVTISGSSSNLASASSACPAATAGSPAYAPNGAVVVAGELKAGSGPVTPGCATRSQLGGPVDIVVGRAGSLYIADAGNSDIVKLNRSGHISVVAGFGGVGTPTPGPATRTGLGEISGVAVDRAGDLYIADPTNDVVERVTPSGRLSIFAGILGHDSGPGGAGGKAVDTVLDDPSAVAVGSNGDVYVANSATGEILLVDRRGDLSVFAGDGKDGAAKPGPALATSLGGAPGDTCLTGLAFDGAGGLLVANPCEGDVLKISHSGRLSVFAGIPGVRAQARPGLAISTDLGTPTSLAVDPAGNVYIGDEAAGLVEKVTPSGRLSLVAGRFGMVHFAPAAVAVNGAGELYIGEIEYGVVEKVKLPAT
jgi:hypothetical protein